MTHISDKIGKPRKKRNCRVCDESIPAGEECHMYSGVESPGGFYTLYFHHECWNHSREWKEWDWDRLMPGDVSRKEVRQIELDTLEDAATCEHGFLVGVNPHNR